ncbi:hypothetical protein RJ639_014297, partial [Escallonia herrerae]
SIVEDHLPSKFPDKSFQTSAQTAYFLPPTDEWKNHSFDIVLLGCSHNRHPYTRSHVCLCKTPPGKLRSLHIADAGEDNEEMSAISVMGLLPRRALVAMVSAQAPTPAEEPAPAPTLQPVFMKQ